MKLEKIESIKEYKSFVDFNWEELKIENFSNLNLIFGENGSGKSSLVSLLKSVTGNTDLQKLKGMEARLAFSNNDIRTCRDGDWDKEVGKKQIQFYDQEFVNRNVHVARKRGTSKTDPGQESTRLIIEFDSQADNLRKYRDKKKEGRDFHKKNLKEYKEEKETVIGFFLSEEDKVLYDEFSDKTKSELKQIEEDFGERLTSLNTLISDDQELLEDFSDIAEIEVPEYDNDFPLLSDEASYKKLFHYDLEKFADISDQELQNKFVDNRQFFRSGISIWGDYPGKCPFCQTDDESTEIKRVIEDYKRVDTPEVRKSEEGFEQLKNNLLAELNQIEQTLGAIDLEGLFSDLEELNQKYPNINIYAVEEKRLYIKPDTKSLKNLKDEISSLEKPDNRNIEDLHNEAEGNYLTIERFEKGYKELVNKKAHLINKFKNRNSTDIEISNRKRQNTREHEVTETKLQFIKSEKIQMQKEKEKAKIDLDKLENLNIFNGLRFTAAEEEYNTYCSNALFQKMLKNINNYFERFHLEFKLVLENDSRERDVPAFSFRILDKGGHERKFEDGISDGEMSVLSACFFFAFIDIQDGNEQKILIFDDPVTSLDNINLDILADLILEKRKLFSQTFILTHHSMFFKFLEGKLGRNNLKKAKRGNSEEAEGSNSEEAEGSNSEEAEGSNSEEAEGSNSEEAEGSNSEEAEGSNSEKSKEGNSEKSKEGNSEKSRYSEMYLVKNFISLGGSFLCRVNNYDTFIKELKKYAFEFKKMSIEERLNADLESVRYGQFLRYEVERYLKHDLLHMNKNGFKNIVEGIKSSQTISEARLDSLVDVYNFCNFTTEHVHDVDPPGRSELVRKIVIFLGATDKVNPNGLQFLQEEISVDLNSV